MHPLKGSDQPAHIHCLNQNLAVSMETVWVFQYTENPIIGHLGHTGWFEVCIFFMHVLSILVKTLTQKQKQTENILCAIEFYSRYINLICIFCLKSL